MKYIYVSPIIQSFRATGTVYVNQLFSTDDLKKQANNAVYKFLDDNADFNVPIYKSNITEIIEDLNGISHVDIKFEPDIPYPVLRSVDPSYRSTFYFSVPGLYPPIDDNGGLYVDIIYSAIDLIIYSYFIIAYDEPSWRAFIELTRTMTPDEIQSGSVHGIKTMTERYFLSNFVKDVYDRLNLNIGISNDTVTHFQDTSAFITVMSDIHKDLSWVIRSNMIDSNGNIAPEYTITTNTIGSNTKTLDRGGFSLGGEIAKINFNSVSVSTQSPYLNYQYK
jgi:hypothetical protein